MADRINFAINTLRREKSANYTKDEKHLLLDKVMPYLNIIENKKTDTITVEAKTKAWVQVTSRYNAANPRGARKTNQLKNLYENLKKRVKKDLLTDREEFRRTGKRIALRRIDDVGWRLIKLLPRLRAFYINPNTTDAHPSLNNEGQDKHCLLLLNKDNANNQTNASNPSPTEDAPNAEYQTNVNVKEEILHDLADSEQLPEASGSESNFNPDNNFMPNSEDAINNVEGSAAEFYSFAQHTVGVQTDDAAFLDMEKEMKRKEIDKLNLDIEMKRLEVEYMRAKLKEQELHVKFKELEYQMKYKEANKMA